VTPLEKAMNNKPKKSFKGRLGDYTICLTQDNSPSFYSSYFDENGHSLSGAKKETLHNYILGCGVHEKLNKLSSIHIYEVGFGSGLGALTTLEELLRNNASGEVLYSACELDDLLALKAIELFEVYNPVIEESDTKVSLSIKKGELYFKITVYFGDARETIRGLKGPPLHAIYQDPFSPAKNPLLWTTEWFCDLRKYCDSSVTMATYTTAKATLKSMIEAGFTVSLVPGFGSKRTSTRASLVGVTSPEVLDALKRSPMVALRDVNFQAP